MYDPAADDDAFIFTFSMLRPYLGRVLLNVSNVDWRNLTEASYVLDDVREALDACVDFMERGDMPAALAERRDEQRVAIERVFARLESAESAPAVHRAHAGQRLAREMADFVAQFYLSAPVEAGAARQAPAGDTLHA